MMSKINNNKMNDLNQIQASRQASVKSAGKNKIDSSDAKITVGEDRLEFSERAGEVGKLVDQVKNMPDVREAKIVALREQIKAGEYNPSGEEIADALLKEE
ncbi:MAG: flagellar biosynthesis anti-sigma factor FlgM [Pyrinomonadaceae bacterium]